MNIEVYAFENARGESVTDWTTMDIAEAREYARRERCSLVARQFEYTDSELVETYCSDDEIREALAAELAEAPAPPKEPG